MSARGCDACRIMGPLLTATGTSGRAWRCVCGEVWDHPASPRSLLEANVYAYRDHPDPALLIRLYDAGLDGIARALEVEATSQPGIGKDDATARINGWLRPPTPTAGPADRSAGGDGFGLGAPSPTS